MFYHHPQKMHVHEVKIIFHETDGTHHWNNNIIMPSLPEKSER